jgi:hypothetical protein
MKPVEAESLALDNTYKQKQTSQLTEQNYLILKNTGCLKKQKLEGKWYKFRSEATLLK